MKMLMVWILTLFAFAVQVAAQCEVETGKAEIASEWDRTFTQNGPGSGLMPKGSAGWVGGDSTYSVLLPSGESAFFFSDTYIGEWPAKKGDGTVTVSPSGHRTMEKNCGPPLCDPAGTLFYARNSIVARSVDGKTLRTLTGPKNENGFSTSYFPEPSKGRNYWMGDAVLVTFANSREQKLLVALHEYDPKMAFYGTAFALLDPVSLRIEKHVEVENMGGTEVHWGTAFHVEKKFIYIYGKGMSDGKKQAFVARAKIGNGLEHLANASNWKVWDGKHWTSDITKRAVIAPPGDSVSDEFSVEKFSVNGKDIYLMSSLDTSGHMKDWSDLTLYSSCRPEGPFIGRRMIYKTPEGGSLKVPGMSAAERLNSGMVIYNPHIHPQFTADGKILISYNSNTSNTGDTVNIDAYRPRFVWVPIKGLKTIK